MTSAEVRALAAQLDEIGRLAFDELSLKDANELKVLSTVTGMNVGGMPARVRLCLACIFAKEQLLPAADQIEIAEKLIAQTETEKGTTPP